MWFLVWFGSWFVCGLWFVVSILFFVLISIITEVEFCFCFSSKRVEFVC